MPDRRFDPLPMTYAELLPELLRLGFVKLRIMAPLTKIPPGYDANVRCDFHSSGPGHHIENCRAFHHKVQDLIDAKTINFALVPNVVNNPMPQHGAHRVNNVEDGEAEDLVVDVEEVQTPLMLKVGIQSLIDEGCLQFARAVEDRGVVSTVTIYFKPSEGRGQRTINAPTIISTPVTISAPVIGSAPTTIVVSGRRVVENNRAVPWKYDNAYRSNRRAESQIRPVNQSPVTIGFPSRAPVTVGPVVDNVGGLGGFTRSGHLFAPQPLRDNNAEALAKAKGKQAAVDEEPVQKEAPEGLFEKDVEEFMKIIKKSDYKVVDQLNQTPSKISILSLLLCSEAHRNALLKMLNLAYVPQEISVNQLEGVIANVSTRHGLGFTDLDLTPEGRNHNKALHITMECNGAVLSHVLVDTGSSLNVFPKKILSKIDVEGVVLTPSDLIVRAFDGSKRSVFGEVTLPVKIGPEIHGPGAVSLTLHQKLKYVWNGQIVTVCGEEDILVSHLSSFKYVEVDGEIHETLCQAFETVSLEGVAFAEQKKPSASIASYKQAMEAEQGEQKGPSTFTSAGLMNHGDVFAASSEDGDSDCDLNNWVRPCAPGESINNWTAEEVVQVTLQTE
ncbi:hypothetical protein KIW84_073389 [Lathyrus oleraceus]|uniref:Uncharacterized protein n=1 Tax=Pisum sativum TaxID=3888 RepID=A0A9D4VNR0_PEA|nr:hypothetical protein KIW84_073389 [Pisum sativum]